MNNIFTIKQIVKTNEIDSLNHVNNIVYLKWVQNISEKHWKYLTQNNKQEKYIWVVIRHEIDYIKPAFIGDEITLKTWVKKIEGAKSIRCVEILKDNVLLAKAQTTWCLLNIKNKRPIRISEEIITFLQPNN